MIKHPLSHTPYESIEFTALDRAIDAQRDAFKESISEAHKLGFETGRDKQLEQVLKWIEDNLGSHYVRPEGCPHRPAIGYVIVTEDVIENLKEAMRPQEDN